MPRYIKLCLALTLLLISVNTLTPIWDNYLEKIGGNIKQAGYAIFIYFATVGIFVPFFGHLQNKTCNVKKNIAWAFLLTALFSLCYILVKEVWQLYLLQFCLGISISLQAPAFDIVYANEANKDSSAPIKWSFYEVTFYAAETLGALAGGYIIYYFGFKVLFAFMAGVAFLGFLMSLRIIPDKVMSDET